ncbi:MAG: tyrosine protein phosphatase [Blastocatellia bacterium]|nr:tyrosine protein phosphatase [Blastocatellia bacterium]
MYWIGTVGKGRLGTMTRPRGGDWLVDDLRQLQQAEGVEVVVSLLEPAESRELELLAEMRSCAATGLEFLSFPIPDYGVPPSRREALTFLRQLLKLLDEGKHIAIHCRQGIGRSSLVAASVLVLTGIPAETAWERIRQARGRSVPDTQEQIRWVAGLTAF